MKESHIRNILIPIDFSKLSRPAIETAKGLARKFGATVHLAHVHEFYYPAGFMAPGGQVALPLITYHDNSVTRLSRDLKAVAKRYDVPAENCQVLSGASTFHEICDFARTLSFDLIVVPTHGYTGIDHFFVGSTAERIVQHSPCPVLVARERGRKAKAADGSINSILVPVDFSKSSFQALQYAIEFAERVAARLIVFHAVQLGYAFTADGYGMYNLPTLEKAVHKDAESQMAEFVRLAKFRGVKFETVVKLGPPVSEICEFAEQRDVDLIITATHGRTGFKHLLMGSVAEQMVRYARRSVLVVPSHPEVRVARLTGTRRAQQSLGQGPMSRVSLSSTNRDRKSLAHPFPERRKTNKFRESHSV